MDTEILKIVDVFTAEDARWILQCRSHLKKETIVNISSRVVYISEIITVKRLQLFMIKLESGLNIIVKTKAHLDWHAALSLNEEYVFTGLIPTSLQKGGTRKHELYAETSKSQLHSLQDVDIETVTSASHWMKRHRKRGTDSVGIVSGIAEPEMSQENQDMFSYQGKITAVLDPCLGVYELDSVVRLFVVRASYESCTWQVGTTLLIQNAHYRKNIQDCKLALYSCVLTSISQISGTRQSSRASISLTVHKLLHQKSLTWAHLHYLYELRRKLHQQFHHGFGQRVVDGVFEAVLSQDSVKGHIDDSPARNILDEFLTQPHTCPMSASSTHKILSDVCCIREIIEQQSQNHATSASGWSHHVSPTSQKVLVAVVETCNRTGKLIVKDDTARIGLISCCNDTQNTQSTTAMPGQASVAQPGSESTSQQQSVFHILGRHGTNFTTGNEATSRQGMLDVAKTSAGSELESTPQQQSVFHILGRHGTNSTTGNEARSRQVMLDVDKTSGQTRAFSRSTDNDDVDRPSEIHKTNTTPHVPRSSDSSKVNTWQDCHEPSSTSAQHHRCSAACSNLTQGTTFVCPLAHLSYLQTIVLLKEYKIVTEINPSPTGTDRPIEGHAAPGVKRSALGEQRESGIKTYLLVDMRNVQYLFDANSIAASKSVSGLTSNTNSMATSKSVCDGTSVDGQTSLLVSKSVSAGTTADNKTSIPSTSAESSEKETTRAKTSVDSKRRATGMLHKHVNKDGTTTFCKQPTCSVRNKLSVLNSGAMDHDKNANCDHIMQSDSTDNVLQGCHKAQSMDVHNKQQRGETIEIDSNTENTDVIQRDQNESFTPKFVVKGRLPNRNDRNNVIGNRRKRKCNDSADLDDECSVASSKSDRKMLRSNTTRDNAVLNINSAILNTDSGAAVTDHQNISGKNPHETCIENTTKSNHRDGENTVKSDYRDSKSTADKSNSDTVAKGSGLVVADLSQVCGLDMVEIYVENKGSVIVNATQGDSFFFLECDLSAGGKIFKVCVRCGGQLVKYHPFVHPDNSYTLTLDRELSPLFTMKLTIAKALKTAMKSKSRILLCVHEQVKLRELWSDQVLSTRRLTPLPVLLRPLFVGCVVSFEGVIVKRNYAQPDASYRPVNAEPALGGVTGQCSMILVQHQQDQQHKIWVYINERDVPCPVGLIPGTLVRFHSLERKVARHGNVYCRFVPFSSVHILSTSGLSDTATSSKTATNIDLSSIPHRYLADVWSQPNTTPFRCICDIQTVAKISLKCACIVCGSMMVSGSCSNRACVDRQAYNFVARATAIVDDGTSNAMVTLTGSSVQSMLRLSHDQWECLQQEISQSGEVFIQQIRPVLNTDLDQFIYRLCESTVIKQTCTLILKPYRSLKDVHTINQEEFIWKEFKGRGVTFTTQCLPFLQFECLQLDIFKP